MNNKMSTRVHNREFTSDYRRENNNVCSEK